MPRYSAEIVSREIVIALTYSVEWFVDGFKTGIGYWKLVAQQRGGLVVRSGSLELLYSLDLSWSYYSFLLPGCYEATTLCFLYPASTMSLPFDRPQLNAGSLTWSMKSCIEINPCSCISFQMVTKGWLPYQCSGISDGDAHHRAGVISGESHRRGWSDRLQGLRSTDSMR